MPRIGLLSDSHGRAEVTRRAVEILADQGARVLIHLGDIETTAVIDQLVVDGATTKTVTDSYLVFGNVDWDLNALGRYAVDLTIRVACIGVWITRIVIPIGILVVPADLRGSGGCH